MISFTILDHFVQGCDKKTATIELLAMLFTFALLGFLLRHVFSSSKSKLRASEEENLNLKMKLSSSEEEINNLRLSSANQERKIKEHELYQKEYLSKKNEMVSSPNIELTIEKPVIQEINEVEVIENNTKEVETPKKEEVIVMKSLLDTIDQNDSEIAPINFADNDNEMESDEDQKTKELEKQERIRIQRERIEKEMAEEREKELLERKKRFQYLEETEKPKEEKIKEVELDAIEEKTENQMNSPQSTEKIDDLKTIEGIGPAIERIMNKAGISTFEEMAASKESALLNILANAGPRYKVHNPSTWPEQAKMLYEGRMDDFKAFTAKLIAGKIVE